MAQNRSGIGIWVTTGIAIEPKLVVASDLLVTTKAVEHRCPGRGCVHEPVDHQCNRLARVVGLEPRDTSRLRVFGWVEHAREFEFLRVGACEHHSEWYGEVRGERIDLSVDPDGFNCEVIFEGKHAPAALKTRDRGDTIVN